jgi:integrase
MRTFFTALVDRELIEKNPFSIIKPVREETGKNTTYSRSEEKRAIASMIKDDVNFYYATRFVKYAFLRRTELSLLQLKHIQWKNKTIIIPSANAKNRTQDSVTIPKTLEKIILKMNILKLDPETFIFAKKFKPGKTKLNRVDDFSDMQREINRELKIKKECTFYSWKHTGAVELYNLTKDPYIVMRQCRHHSIAITMNYLRSLGCGVSEAVRAW